MSSIPLIDQYLKEYTFNEYHEIIVNSPIEKVYQVSRNIDLSKSGVITTLFKIRCLPTRRMHLQDFISDMGFTSIEEKIPEENLIVFWAKTKVEPVGSRQDFINNTISPKLKAAWNFRFKQLADGKTLVGTETRVLCIHPVTRVVFPCYWQIVKPFSGLIRKKMLQIIKDESEASD